MCLKTSLKHNQLVFQCLFSNQTENRRIRMWKSLSLVRNATLVRKLKCKQMYHFWIFFQHFFTPYVKRLRFDCLFVIELCLFLSIFLSITHSYSSSFVSFKQCLVVVVFLIISNLFLVESLSSYWVIFFSCHWSVESIVQKSVQWKLYHNIQHFLFAEENATFLSLAIILFFLSTWICVFFSRYAPNNHQFMIIIPIYSERFFYRNGNGKW